MKIKVDEDLPKAVAESIRRVIPDTLAVVDEGLSGILDPNLWDTTQREGRFLITGDKAFANIIKNTRQEPTTEYYCSGPMETASCKCVDLSRTY